MHNLSCPNCSMSDRSRNCVHVRVATGALIKTFSFVRAGALPRLTYLVKCHCNSDLGLRITRGQDCLNPAVGKGDLHISEQLPREIVAPKDTPQVDQRLWTFPETVYSLSDLPPIGFRVAKSVPRSEHRSYPYHDRPALNQIIQGFSSDYTVVLGIIRDRLPF